MTDAILLTALTPEEIEQYVFAVKMVKFGWLLLVLGFVLVGFGFGLGARSGERVGFAVLGGGLLTLVASGVFVGLGERLNPGDPIIRQVLVENSVQLTWALGSFLCATTLGRLVVFSVQPWIRLVFDPHGERPVALQQLMGTLNDDVQAPDMFPSLTRKWGDNFPDGTGHWSPTAMERVRSK